MFEVRSSELETGLSSNDGPVEVGDDTGVSTVQEVRAFHAVDEVCGLDGDTLARFRDRFQFLDSVRIRLPREEDRACHFFLGELLDSFGIALGQLMPNSWRIVISCMGIWLAATDEDMIRVDELVYLYRLKSSKEFGYYELVASSVGTLKLDKRRPKLKSRYKERVEKASEYAKSIEDFDDLVDPRTLAFYCLGPNPSAFVLCNLDIEEKKRMTTKFNQSMYARMRAKKIEPLSNLGAKTVRVTEKGAPVAAMTPLTLGTESARTASPDTSVE
ncbi:hypothetical protein SO802_026656 [Lithocarpus litseifolius]|uniref:Uncharacterized protein n=1 Tax=Lithocarpus litseifolius TaxID=425828 RepID=A0AAW2C0G0_9ROSI